jgi:hypothetical protein
MLEMVARTQADIEAEGWTVLAREPRNERYDRLHCVANVRGGARFEFFYVPAQADRALKELVDDQ